MGIFRVLTDSLLHSYFTVEKKDQLNATLCRFLWQTDTSIAHNATDRLTAWMEIWVRYAQEENNEATCCLSQMEMRRLEQTVCIDGRCVCDATSQWCWSAIVTLAALWLRLKSWCKPVYGKLTPTHHSLKVACPQLFRALSLKNIYLVLLRKIYGYRAMEAKTASDVKFGIFS